MKTYTKIIKEPRLKITYDASPQSPREWDNLGYFITCENSLDSPDNHEDMISMIQNLADQSSNQNEHMEMIKREFPSNFKETVIAIYPIVKCKHGGISYSLEMKKGFDFSNCGFYIVTDKTAKKSNCSEDLIKSKKFESFIKNEIELYNQYITGEVYRFELYDKDGVEIESCGDIYDIEGFKENLPKEWAKENMEDYLVKLVCR